MSKVIEAAAIFPKTRFSTLPDNYPALARAQVLVRLGFTETADDYETIIGATVQDDYCWTIEVAVTPRK